MCLIWGYSIEIYNASQRQLFVIDLKCEVVLKSLVLSARNTNFVRLHCTHTHKLHHLTMILLIFFSGVELLFFQWRLQGLSGMARAPLQMGNRNCLIQIKICHLKFLQQVFCAPHNHWLGKAASVLRQRPCLMRFVGSRVYCTNAHYDKTVVVSHSTTVIYCDWTITLACHIYKKTSSYSRCL